MNVTKNNCMICHIPFDDYIHLPRILPDCNHTICSLCISKNLFSNNTFICPKDNFIYTNINNIDYFKVNKNILDKIKQKENKDNLQYLTYNIEDLIKNDVISLEKNKKIKDKTDEILINNTLLSSNNQQYYIKKNIKFNNNKINFSNNSLICPIHSLPLNIICLNDRQKICNQCALNNIHSDHQIISENKFIEYINELIQIYQNIENNQNNYSKINDININFILVEIENKINSLKNKIKRISKDLLDNITLQSKQIEKFLDLRKKEIFVKFQYNDYNINNLKESTNNWMEIVSNKLYEANKGNDNGDLEYLKLLDSDINKNIFNLIKIGRQLNERFIFIQEKKDIVYKLNKFNKKGMKIKQNNNIIDKIMSNPIIINEDLKENKIYDNNLNKYYYNESIINYSKNITTISNNNDKNENNKNININFNKNILETSLFKIEEDKEIIESLHLTPISSLYKQTSNIFVTYDNDYEEDNELSSNNTISIISNFYSPKNSEFNTNLYNKKVYSKKKLNKNYNNEFIINFNKDNKMNKTHNNFFDNNKIITLKNKSIYENEKSRHKKLSLSGDISRFNTQFYDNSDNNIEKRYIPLSPIIKKVLFPKLLKVKTCDVFFKGSKKNKNKKETVNEIIKNKNKNRLKNKNENTIKKISMSPKIKNKYNLINNIINIDKNILSSQKSKNKNKGNLKINLEYKKNKENKKKKCIRCSSCSNSNSINKKEVEKIPIFFNLNLNDENKKINKENASDISNSKNLNKSCCKEKIKNNKISNFNSSLIKKDINELQKNINNQMKKSNPFFNKINMSGIGIQLLSDYLQKNQGKKYKELKLPNCNLNDEDFNILIKNIIDNEIELSTLNVSYNNISDNSSRYIFEIIKKGNSLKSIFLYNNKFSQNFKNKIKNYNKDNVLDNKKLFI